MGADAVSQPSNTMSSTPELSSLSGLSNIRKTTLLIIFCFALFLESFNTSSLLTAIPVISDQLHISDSRSVWLLSAYQIGFSALLLISGRVSDLYNPRWVFLIGAFVMAISALVAGFLRSAIPLMVLRAITGIGAALTIPSALHLIVHMYPDPAEQARAVSTFGGVGGIGLVMGLVIGALFTSYVSWPWVFFFGAIVSGAIACAIAVLVPQFRRAAKADGTEEKVLRVRRLDFGGVTAFAVTLILFVFAVTSGSISGWATAGVLCPLIISLFVGALFFWWEARLDESLAALPPRIWSYQNFSIYLLVSLIPSMWWSSVFLLFGWYWELVHGWSAIDTAVHFLPVALGVFPAIPLAAALQTKMPFKYVLYLGHALTVIGSVLLPFASSPARYWPFAFPGFLIGTAGVSMLYATSNVALLAVTPAEVSGIVSAIHICVVQVGGAAGISIVTSIQTSVQNYRGGPDGFEGRAAGLWFLFATVVTIAVLFIAFVRGTDRAQSGSS